MAYFTLRLWNGDELAAKVRGALPRNPKVLVTEVTYPGIGDKHTEKGRLKLKGVALGKSGLVFTFDDGHRHILESGEEISITRSRISFTDSRGAKITLTLK